MEHYWQSPRKSHDPNSRYKPRTLRLPERQFRVPGGLREKPGTAARA